MRLSRRRLILGGLGLAGFLGTGTVGYGVDAAARELRVTEYRLIPPGWPPEQRLTIAVVADLHAGGPNMGLERIRQVVEAANGLAADLVVLLGDYFATHLFVTERVAHADWAAELARLSAPLGVWAILGNHDWWYDIDGVRNALKAVRIPVLENAAISLGPPGRRFWLAGLGDQMAIRLGRGRYRGVDDLAGTLAQVRGEEPVILLAHEPDIFPRVPARVALTLAGHTHGGQLRIPLVWPLLVPSRFGARFAYGDIVGDARHMIVSGGLGTSVVPARVGVPPEIVHVVLGG